MKFMLTTALILASVTAIYGSSISLRFPDRCPVCPAEFAGVNGVKCELVYAPKYNASLDESRFCGFVHLVLDSSCALSTNTWLDITPRKSKGRLHALIMSVLSVSELEETLLNEAFLGQRHHRSQFRRSLSFEDWSHCRRVQRVSPAWYVSHSGSIRCLTDFCLALAWWDEAMIKQRQKKRSLVIPY